MNRPGRAGVSSEEVRDSPVHLSRPVKGIGDLRIVVRGNPRDLQHQPDQVLSWNPILTKDSCGSEGSSYRRTRNGGLSPLFRLDSLVLRMQVLRMRDCSFSDPGFYGRSATPGYRRRPWGDLIVPTGWRRWGRSMDFPSFCCISLKGLKRDSASSWIPNEGTLREPPTPTTVHVRSILDLTNRPSYLFYVLDSPSLSQ
ncbi:hypothetical protein ACOSP7_024046 [Xanthoceras sorbifolium]